jgi:RNA polymerase sigma-70 factor (ECF subfamily)
MKIAQDKKLFKRIKEKDRNAFLQAYDAYADDIFRFILFNIGRSEDARDMTSAVFLKVWEYAQNRGLKEDKSLRAFIYKVARNLVIDYYRTSNKSKNEKSVEDLADNLADEKQNIFSKAEDNSDLERIKKCLGRLKDEYREIILMRFVDELSFAEISETTGKSIGSLRVLSFRALQALKELMGEKEG